jgi:hypothetical protein
LCKVIRETVGEVKVVEDMHQRKAEMARQSDAFIALPGKWFFFTCHVEPNLLWINC